MVNLGDRKSDTARFDSVGETRIDLAFYVVQSRLVRPSDPRSMILGYGE